MATVPYSLVIVFFAVALAGAGLAVSLCRRVWWVAAAALVTSSVLPLTASYWAGLGTGAIRRFLGDPALVRDLCLVQIVESVVVIVAGVKLIERRYAGRGAVGWILVWYAPSPVLIALSGVLLQGVFTRAAGASFMVTALLFAASLWVVLMGVALALRAAISRWERRIETRALVALLQLCLAMFTPLLVMRTAQPLLEHPPLSTMVIMVAVIGGICTLGFAVRFFVRRERLSPLWQRLHTFCS